MNKTFVGIAPQLLSARVSLEVQEKKNYFNSQFSATQTKLLRARKPLPCVPTQSDLQDVRENFETVAEENSRYSNLSLDGNTLTAWGASNCCRDNREKKDTHR